MTNIALGTLKGRGVVGSGGRYFGVVEDLEVDTKTWRITSLLIRVHQNCLEELGLKKPLFKNVKLSVPVPDIGEIGDVILMKITMEDLARLIKGAPRPTRKERVPEKEFVETSTK